MKRLVLWITMAATTACSNGTLMRYVPPNTASDLDFVPVAPGRTQLDNGIGILTSNFEHPATTTLALVFGRGYVHDRVPGTGRLLGEWLQLEADTNLSPGLDAVGAVVSTQVSATSTRLSVTVEHQDVPAAMQALADLLIDADSELAFEAAKQRQDSLLASWRKSPRELALLALVRSSIAPSSAALESLGVGTQASLQSISFGELKATRNDMVMSSSACWLVVGPHEGETVRTWVQNASGSWSNRGAPKPAQVVVERKPGSFTFVPLRGYDTATVVVGTSAPSHPPLAVLTAVSVAAGESDRVMRGLAQSTYGVYPLGVDDGPLSLQGIHTRVSPEDARDAASFMVHSFEAVTKLTEAQLDYSVTRAVVDAYAERGQASAHLLGLHEAFERGYQFPMGAPFRSLPIQPGPEHVVAAFRTHFLESQLHVIIVGDPEVIEPQLKGVTYTVRMPEDLVAPTPLGDKGVPVPAADGAAADMRTLSPWETAIPD